ncbi:response regulator transcription factor, partial [Acinetobacter baumannii]|uniref:response regulator transcription factor n=1 Tax=Acinetobacter baumannii TaxID=470 RepID=UPI0013D6983E
RALLRERRGGGDGPGVAGFRRGRVLVVDGSATYLPFLAGLLAQEGHAVTTAAGPDDALAALAGPDAPFD